MCDLTRDTFEDDFIILINLKPIATMSDTFKDSRMFFFIFGGGLVAILVGCVHDFISWPFVIQQ
jgi:hypothetical protein